MVLVMHVIARMNTGGPAVEVMELMKSLDGSCFSQLIVTGACGTDEREYEGFNSAAANVELLTSLGRSISPFDDLRAWLEIRRAIRVYRPDIIHTHTAKAGVLGRTAALSVRSRPRIVHTFHGHLLVGYFGSLKSWIVTRIERALARGADHLIAVGEQVKADLVSAGIGSNTPFSVIRSGITLEGIPLRRDARAALGIGDDQVVVTFLGRLTGIKRLDRFLETARLVHERNESVHFLVVGGGDEEERTRQAAEDAGLPITFLGWRSDRERILAATDLMLLTSDNEGVPLTLIEAAMVGVPSVSTDVGSVGEIVIDGVTGTLCSQDANQLAGAVLALSEDQDERARLGAAARLYANERFTTEAFLAGHVSVYRQVLESRHVGGTRWLQPRSSFTHSQG